jgi:allophanate hydrolase subunit 1
MRINEKFDGLHLEIIRQMQLSVEKMTVWFERNQNYQKELLGKIKTLEQENENLKKRTY